MSNDANECKPEPLSKLRISNIGNNTSPRALREDLLRNFFDVGEVSIHSDEDLTYALIDMPYSDAEAAVKCMDQGLWRGARIEVEFANHADSQYWMPGHEWKPPKGCRY